MKKIFILVFCMSNIFANDLKNTIDHIVEVIKGETHTVEKDKIYSLKNPFILKKIVKKDNNDTTSFVPIDEEDEKDVLPTISAIMNKKILVNGNWYKKGENILTYKIVKIYNNKVILKHKEDGKIETIYLHKPSKIIISKGK